MGWISRHNHMIIARICADDLNSHVILFYTQFNWHTYPAFCDKFTRNMFPYCHKLNHSMTYFHNPSLSVLIGAFIVSCQIRWPVAWMKKVSQVLTKGQEWKVGKWLKWQLESRGEILGLYWSLIYNKNYTDSQLMSPYTHSPLILLKPGPKYHHSSLPLLKPALSNVESLH